MNINEAQKHVYEVDYKEMKKKGYPFHPFSTWKDVVLALLILLILLALSIFKGVHLDDPADPTSSYLPRPEWYFMFLFQLLKMFPSWAAIIPGAILPGLAGLVLVALPFFDRNPYRSASKRPVATSLGIASIVGFLVLTAIPYWEDAHTHHALSGSTASHAGGTSGGEHAAAAGGASDEGGKIFESTCKMCHGADGTQIPNVKLFDKAFLEGKDVVKTVTDGKGGMPSFKSQFSAEQIKAVSDYLHAQAK